MWRQLGEVSEKKKTKKKEDFMGRKKTGRHVCIYINM
jgi:hypothetical protein